MQEGILAQLYTLVKAHPYEEICGVIAKDRTIHPIKNAAKNTKNCFVFDKKEYFALIKKFNETGNKIICVYHSHPVGDPTPSAADLAFSKRSGLPQLIVTTNSYRLVEHA